MRRHAREDDAGLAELVRRVRGDIRARGITLAAFRDEERAREAVDARALEAVQLCRFLGGPGGRLRLDEQALLRVFFLRCLLKT